jgi:hypothetical protein
VAHDELAPLSGELEEQLDPPIEVEDGLSLSVIYRLMVLFGVTVLSLLLAWWWPENTALHFWLVAQLMPVIYVALLCWSVWERKA